ncbi:MAG: phosphatase domain-containing protein [Planctomycetota bacterium]|jgi:atypical dual specificity phosphatase
MDELPDALKQTNFSFLIEGEIAGMSGPFFNTYEALAGIGIRGLVALTGTPRPPAEELKIAYLHEPVIDFRPPTLAQIERIVQFVRENKPVAVHCGAGFGRTGTVLACYLVSEHGHSAEEAIERVRKARPGSIETNEQLAFIHECEEQPGGESG